ncbi:uncharacterized protein LOC133913817 [Phragmites australis]|uniref:uncharacterized protein LOC133913817 n=1 Tax=Phragmites australis TaxID=29695 RepID=UPI002D766AC0|nr:uncharacterized protein LOC133913817 [Phragmites australis]
MASPHGPGLRQERQSAWPDLPPELLERIVAVLGPRDRVAVRLVCASWRAYVRESFPSDLPFEVPRLLIRRPGLGGVLAFFSLHHRKILSFEFPARLRAGRCCGHIAGWFAMALDSDRAIVLCNPVSGQSMAFPPPPVFPISKIVLSAPPTSPGWVAAVLGRTGTIVLLQLAVSGAWMTIGIDEGAEHGGFRDMVFWRGRLCALGHDGAVLAFRADLRVRAAAVSLLRDAEHPLGLLTRGRWQLYLVEGDGELLVVRKLYKVSRHGDEVDWEVEVRQLASPERRRWDLLVETPGQALFVGSVVSTVVPVALYAAAASGLRESCVYFARRDVEMLAPHAICEYSLLEEEMRGVPVAGGHAVDVEPVWISPFI